jgi:hypothetical protein
MLVFPSHKEKPNDALVENYAKKESQSFFHCGFIDHYALQSLNDCTKKKLVYQLIFRNLGVCNILLERS